MKQVVKMDNVIVTVEADKQRDWRDALLQHIAATGRLAGEIRALENGEPLTLERLERLVAILESAAGDFAKAQPPEGYEPYWEAALEADTLFCEALKAQMDSMHLAAAAAEKYQETSQLLQELQEAGRLEHERLMKLLRGDVYARQENEPDVD